ncbi:MAG: hypothetical protein HQL97_05130 [Magnetococcales bacterium]|nr:hypothetical protein [Magnetococcales bacterium]
MDEPPVILVVDIEASGLHDGGYPTEIAWMDPIRDQAATSFLIRPSERWLQGKWDFKAERLTGITREMLIKEGVSLYEVAARFKERMVTADLILTDAPEWDRHWVEALFREAWVSFELPAFYDLHAYVQEHFGAVMRLQPQPLHRAGDDVERLVGGLINVIQSKRLFFSSLARIQVPALPSRDAQLYPAHSTREAQYCVARLD